VNALRKHEFEMVGGPADGQTVRFWRAPYPPHVDRGGERYFMCLRCKDSLITFRTTAAARALTARTTDGQEEN
jgi:hypothetical protein